jgi:hypothetical protein
MQNQIAIVQNKKHYQAACAGNHSRNNSELLVIYYRQFVLGPSKPTKDYPNFEK